MLAVVLTTIQTPTRSVERLWQAARKRNAEFYVIGDKKGPYEWRLEHSSCLGLMEQLQLPFQLIHQLPTSSYARKNIGYLLAISRGASSIFETDDDNAPMDCWGPRAQKVCALSVESNGWVNVYSHFTHEHVWPRGFPLSEISCSDDGSIAASGALKTISAPIQQGLVSGSPDVDAIWRLVLDRPLYFRENDSLFLPPGAWCPFNSQSTWWFPEAYPLMYLPSYVSFRMTDIWRSFIAQRCLWEMDLGLVFHGPEMIQERNPHDLEQDFQQEVPGYLNNKKICETLESLTLEKSAVLGNLHKCYEAMVGLGVVPSCEMELVESWIKDFEEMPTSRE